ncbi:dual oxidase maturation factor 2-like isoform X2 [Tachypleus tridentatus]|uniref:dual oxidase maturation factor 2-like isoform X2 n=1 Tax=Tachypleus tridentatus TaxID=6853 RepID=UPI003FD2E199
MLKGWFDAFRDNDEASYYSLSNRTPAIHDVTTIIICISFSTFYVAFLLIFPGIRKKKFSTLVCLTTSLLVGIVIMLSLYGSSWHVAEASVSTAHTAFSRKKIDTKIGVNIGLNSVNITLQAGLNTTHLDINYNEKFSWVKATEMKEHYQEAQIKGLPFPLLTVAEYLSLDMEGFSWGRQYRQAGYYSYILLWTAFALWILSNILFSTIPRYGALGLQLTGALILLTIIIYSLLLPVEALIIPFEGGTLTFKYGWCFWLLLAIGIIALAVGVIATTVDIMFPNKFSTILDDKYDDNYRYLIEERVRIKRTQRRKTKNEKNKDPLPQETSAPGHSNEGIENTDFEDDDSSDSPMENEEKAVSLNQFGKYMQQKKRGTIQAISRKVSVLSNKLSGNQEENVQLEEASTT